MSEPVVTRFAPSPTGFLHIGGVRIALGDVVVADLDGAVIVPRRVAHDVVESALHVRPVRHRRVEPFRARRGSVRRRLRPA